MSKIYVVGTASVLAFLGFVALFPNMGTDTPPSSNIASESAQRRVVAHTGSTSPKLHKDFEGWRFECEKEAENCRIFQRLAFQQKAQSGELAQKLALNFMIYIGQNDAGDKVPRVRFVTPLGLDLTSGLGIRVDGGQEYQIPFQMCSSTGCVSDFQLGADVLAALKSGQIAFVGYRLPNAKPVVLKTALSGLSDAYSALIESHSQNNQNQK